MPRRKKVEPKPWWTSTVTISTALGMLVSAFASVMLTIGLIRGILAGAPLTEALQGQLVVALTPLATFAVSAVAFFARIFQKDHAPIEAALTPRGLRRVRAQRAARAARSTADRALAASEPGAG